MRIPFALVEFIARPLYKLWTATLRYTVVGREPVRVYVEDKKIPLVFVFWHDELFPVLRLGYLWQWKIATLVSRNKDGEYLARLLQRLGYGTVRGSSSRGGSAALLKAAKVMRNEHASMCITVDGPRGPRHVVKPGAIFLAQTAKVAIVPVRVEMSYSKKFNSWDRFQLPWPGSRVKIILGVPYTIDATLKLDAAILLEECARLQAKLGELVAHE